MIRSTNWIIKILNIIIKRKMTDMTDMTDK